MAQENKSGNERTGTGAVDPTTNVLSTPSTSTSRSVDPTTHTISTEPGMHTGREESSGAKGQAREMADRAESKAHQVADQAREKADHLADQAKSKVTSQLDSQKERATESISSISDALRQTSSNLRSKNEDQVAGFVDSAAEQMDRFTSYLQSRSAAELLDEAQRLARREPALFVGGAFVLGLLGARFFKSHSPQRDYYGGGYGRSAYGGYRRSRTYAPHTPGAYYGDEEYGTAGSYNPSRSRGYTEYEAPARSNVGQPRGWEVE